MNRNIILVLTLFYCVNLSQCDEIRCSEAFCETYIADQGCPGLAIECRAQNSTHNGKKFYVTPCNCCQTCLVHLVKDDVCSLGSPGAPTPKSMCGPGLYCTKGKTADIHPTCQPMLASSKCYTQQKEFDDKNEKGLLGHLMTRPKCDGSGYFQPTVCVPGQICYCVSKDGERIFGEAVSSYTTELMMHCSCSRMAHEATQLLQTAPGRPVVVSRCSEDGAFEPLQCTSETCMCVDTQSGNPVTRSINRTVTKLEELECFDKKLYNINATYEQTCELELMEKLEEIYQYEEDGFNILDTKLELCQKDGWYNRVQKNEDKYVCVDKQGIKIGNFEALTNKDIDCNCARAWQMLVSAKGLELPECCPNGNYPNLSCRRGLCYCTDRNGNQISTEVPREQIDTLECYNNGSYC